MTSPKKITAALTPKSPMNAARSEIPVSIAIRTTMRDALSEYSHQRAGFRPRARFRRYQSWSPGSATAAWSTAARKRKAATAGPTRRS
jgi:hypothetical protein